MAEGSVYRRKDGRWCAALQVNGQRRVKYAKTKREARHKLAELQRSVGQSGGLAQPGTRTVNDLLDEWLATAQVRTTTRAHYEWAINAHVRDTIGPLRLSQLQPGDLQRLYDTLPGVRLPSKIHRILNKALTKGVQWGWLAANPADRVTAPTYQPPRRTLWTEEQLQAFLEGVAGHKYEAAWLLALTTGLRISELLGLQWQDIDLEGRTLDVVRTRVRQARRHEVSTPKTEAGRRTVSLPEQAVSVLGSYREMQDEWREQAGEKWREGAWVFTTESGKPLPHSSLQKSLQRLCERLGIPNIGAHGLRHLHATLLLAEGLPVPAVSARLGHSNPQVTMAIYAHALPRQDQQAAEMIGRALEGAER